jgi:hypothetical protein
MANTGTPGAMSDVMRFFGMKVSEFRTEWKDLSESDRDALKAGIGKTDKNGVPEPTATLTY